MTERENQTKSIFSWATSSTNYHFTRFDINQVRRKNTEKAMKVIWFCSFSVSIHQFIFLMMIVTTTTTTTTTTTIMMMMMKREKLSQRFVFFSFLIRIENLPMQCRFLEDDRSFFFVALLFSIFSAIPFCFRSLRSVEKKRIIIQ